MFVHLSNAVRQQLIRGDGVIPGGIFSFSFDGLAWKSVNANNHQQTWGVLGAAINALEDFMVKKKTFGTVAFEIWDGGNQVARAYLAPPPPP